jgi:cytochrome c oxidase subunit 2
MDREERIWLGVLVGVFLIFNAVTLSPLVPWQSWLVWSRPAPARVVQIDIANYQMNLPAGGIEVRAGEFVEFVATSRDVTYGFGVFRKDGTMVFQMQVLPKYQNRIVWKFDEPGTYDVRSTEYSGPKHPDMFIPDAIRVVP